ncbi:MAG: phage tail protein, partial [Pseudonocardiaceae bacterium]
VSLGNWSTCKGLDFDGKIQKIREHGAYEFENILFADTQHSAIKLERAVDDQSASLQTWLATELRTQPGMQPTSPGKTASITLFDQSGTTLLSWRLRGVYPKGWSCSDLRADKSGLAIEKLELVHEGYSCGAAAPALPQITRATLSGTPGGSLAFQFNPLKVSMSKKASTEGGRGMITNSFEDAVKAVANLSITLSDVNLVGPTVKTDCIKLLTWATPTGGAGGAGMSGFKGTGTVYKLPILTFTWGSGMSYRVVLEKVTLNYERFSPQGTPLWVKATLDLKEYAEEMPPTNPSSGGLSGRTKHTVTMGDSVVRIATANYGTPSVWRAVAEANRLDDPLRLAPGRVLYIPAATEVLEPEEVLA